MKKVLFIILGLVVLVVAVKDIYYNLTWEQRMIEYEQNLSEEDKQKSQEMQRYAEYLNKTGQLNRLYR